MFCLIVFARSFFAEFSFGFAESLFHFAVFMLDLLAICCVCNLSSSFSFLAELCLAESGSFLLSESCFEFCSSSFLSLSREFRSRVVAV